MAEGGWTLLGDDADDAKSMHPRFLAKKSWPLPAAEVEEEAEIAGTPEESQKAEAVRNEHDLNASNHDGIDETQSQDQKTYLACLLAQCAAMEIDAPNLC